MKKFFLLPCLPELAIALAALFVALVLLVAAKQKRLNQSPKRPLKQVPKHRNHC